MLIRPIKPIKGSSKIIIGPGPEFVFRAGDQESDGGLVPKGKKGGRMRGIWEKRI